MPAKPQLTISPEKVSYIIMKAYEFDAKEEGSDPDEGSNASDDRMIDVLEDTGDDATEDELKSFIGDLNVDEQVDLVALAWLGREDNTLADWPELRAEAARAHNKRTASYLLGMPQLGDYLAGGLEQFGISFEEIEREEF
ncbi:MAG TPA: DUF3775 domain-containing protein [Rhizomicrobium sp.]|nr:DUF3775 domain-containing protein [Rhizomicrobium sp.]